MARLSANGCSVPNDIIEVLLKGIYSNKQHAWQILETSKTLYFYITVDDPNKVSYISKTHLHATVTATQE